MTTPTPDPVTALVAYLRANINAPTLVFGQELPASQADSMPKPVVVCRSAGGPLDRGFLTLGNTRIDVRCYGATPFAAMSLYQETHALMKYGIQRIAVGPTLLHSATLESGPNHLREPDLDWAFILSSWLVKSAQVAIV
jgi:hypothetical protein